jgi:hypothetical protein
MNMKVSIGKGFAALQPVLDDRNIAMVGRQLAPNDVNEHTKW